MSGWRDFALCRGLDTNEVFYQDGPMSKARRARLDAEAKAICCRCPVTQACLEDALREPWTRDWGIRGATTRDERIEIRRERGQRVALTLREKRARQREAVSA